MSKICQEDQECDANGKEAEAQNTKPNQQLEEQESPNESSVLVCHLCHKVFKRKCSLKSHLNKHAGKSQCNCKDCDLIPKQQAGRNKEIRVKGEKDGLKIREVGVKENGEKVGKESVIRVEEEYGAHTKNEVVKNEEKNEVEMREREKDKETVKKGGTTKKKVVVRKENILEEIEIKESGEDEERFEEENDMVDEIEEREERKAREEDKKAYLCDHCGRCYKQSASLTRHLQVHMPATYECQVCEKRLTHPYRVARHMRMHADKKYRCHVCHKLFAHNGALKKHLLSHNEKSLQCQNCEKKFSHKAYLDVHMLTHTREKPHKCELCEKHFTQKSQLNVHMAKHTGIRKHECDVCGKRFSQRNSLNDHKSVHTDERFRCKLCDREYKHKSSLSSHMSVHSGKTFSCNKCGKQFKHRGSIYSHMCTGTYRSAQDEVDEDSESDFDIDVQNLLCGECGLSYNSLKELSLHMKVHNVDPQEFIKNVNKSLHTNKILEYRVKKRPKGLACEKCGTLFTQKSALTTHMKATHGPSKDFKCSTCEKEFARKSYLDSHMVMHTGKRNHKCEVCSKEFTQKSSLNSHMNLHSERYKCTDCDKSFGRCSDFIKHKKEVHFLKVELLEPFTTISHEVFKEDPDCKMMEIDEMMDLVV